MKIPTQLTMLRIVLAPVFFVLVVFPATPQVGWATVVFAVAAATDWWDGHFARRMNLTSSLGAFLDPLADKLLTSAAFIALAWLGYIEWWMVAVIIARDIYLTGLRGLDNANGIRLKTNYLAKVKTFAQMTFIVLMLVALDCASGMLGSSMASIGREVSESDFLFWPMFAITIVTLASAVKYSYENWPILHAAAMRYVFRRASQETT